MAIKPVKPITIRRTIPEVISGNSGSSVTSVTSVTSVNGIISVMGQYFALEAQQGAVHPD